MPYRFELPAGEEAVHHINGHLGTPKLVAMKSNLYKLIYDAPETTITLREREAMRFPLTVVVGCAVCNAFRAWRDWPGYSGEPIPEEFYQNAEVRNLDWPGFTVRERLLIDFVERFTDDAHKLNADDAFWDLLQANFTETEIGDIVIMAGVWGGFGWGLAALGVGSVCELPARSTAAAIAAE